MLDGQLDLFLSGAAPPDAEIRAACIDATGLYRYSLTRVWNQAGPRVVWVMLNPSTADARLDDPTIRRCLAFSKREGFGALTVVNLFAFRATDPAKLATAADPVGPDNDTHIEDAVRQADKVIAAWGADTAAAKDDRARVLAVCGMVDRVRPLWCLGCTKDGSPRHPLYVPGNTAVQPYLAWKAWRNGT